MNRHSGFWLSRRGICWLALDSYFLTAGIALGSAKVKTPLRHRVSAGFFFLSAHRGDNGDRSHLTTRQPPNRRGYGSASASGQPQVFVGPDEVRSFTNTSSGSWSSRFSIWPLLIKPSCTSKRRIARFDVFVDVNNLPPWHCDSSIRMIADATPRRRAESLTMTNGMKSCSKKDWFSTP